MMNYRTITFLILQATLFFSCKTVQDLSGRVKAIDDYAKLHYPDSTVSKGSTPNKVGLNNFKLSELKTYGIVAKPVDKSAPISGYFYSCNDSTVEILHLEIVNANQKELKVTSIPVEDIKLVKLRKVGKRGRWLLAGSLPGIAFTLTKYIELGIYDGWATFLAFGYSIITVLLSVPISVAFSSSDDFYWNGKVIFYQSNHKYKMIPYSLVDQGFSLQ